MSQTKRVIIPSPAFNVKRGILSDYTTYSEKLLSPLWDEKRLKILKRDGFLCRSCQRKKLLHVHHLIYIDGREPWQYRDADLLTLCEDCHDSVHEITGSSEQIERGHRTTTYPYMARSIGEVITRMAS